VNIVEAIIAIHTLSSDIRTVRKGCKIQKDWNARWARKMSCKCNIEKGKRVQIYTRKLRRETTHKRFSSWNCGGDMQLAISAEWRSLSF